MNPDDKYTYETYQESGVIKDNMYADGRAAQEAYEANLNEYTGGFTNEQHQNIGSGSEGDDLNKFAKAGDGGDAEMDAVLDNFHENNWGDLSLEEQKQSMTDLAACVAADTGNENPPEIVFTSDMPDGSYGSYDSSTNTITINENMLDDSAEAVDTVAHEMWHAYQQQCIQDPTNAKAAEYQEGFDNYISPEYDFEVYQNQMVEAEARDYAQGIKNRIG